MTFVTNNICIHIFLMLTEETYIPMREAPLIHIYEYNDYENF